MRIIKEHCSVVGTSGDCLVLSQYTEEVKGVFSLKLGDFVEGWELTEIGDVRIGERQEDRGTDFLVTYIVAPQPIGEGVVNTVEGLSRLIRENPSIEIVDKMRKWRKILYKKYGVKLQGFVVWNSLYLDEFGQLLPLTYTEQKRRDYLNKTEPIIGIEEFRRKVDDACIHYTQAPGVESVCAHCRQGWTLDTIRDVIREDGKMYHCKCNEYVQDQVAITTFKYIAQSVFGAEVQVVPIRNEYGSEGYRGCWCILHTEYGSIKIGWRKRVIQIEWLSSYVEFALTVFKQENVTQDFSKTRRMIHADSVADAISYLQRAKASHI